MCPCSARAAWKGSVRQGLALISPPRSPSNAGKSHAPAPEPVTAHDAEPAALASWVFEVVQIVLMLPPAPIKSAADARATKAISRVYSIRSCPSSSAKNVQTNCLMTKILFEKIGSEKLPIVSTDRIRRTVGTRRTRARHRASQALRRATLIPGRILIPSYGLGMDPQTALGRATGPGCIP